MRQYLLKRLFLLFLILWGVSSAVFLLLHLVPGDPVDLILGELALNVDRDFVRESLGLNRPLMTQYIDFLKGIVVGDWGSSFFDHRSVLLHISERYGATLELAISSIIFAVAISLPIGIFAAIKKYSLSDHLAMFFSLIGISMPNFWLGPLLVLFFSVELGWFPVAGRGSFLSFVLPTITLGTALAAIISRMTRTAMLEVLEKEYVQTARAKGLTEWMVIWKHTLRNALNPVVTIVGLQLGALLAGAIITEKIFNWPGLGSLLIDSISRRDYPVVQGCVLIISFTYVFINTLTDCIYKVVDPRVRLN